MAYKAYKVGADGKAPKGLNAEDYVVTGGGTYRITGVNEDGTYRSERVSNVNTDTYKGSYAAAPVAEERRSEPVMPYYPKATAPAPVVEEERPETVIPYYPKAQPVVSVPVQTVPSVSAEAEKPSGDNTETQLQLGYTAPAFPTVSYPNAEVQKPPVVDLTPYLRQQAAAQIESELAGLKTAYENSMRGIQEAEEAIPGTYEAARNSAAAQDAIARKTFQEQAAATGLNTGTSGQAELSRSAVYRGVLAGLDKEEADAINALRQQQADVTAQYESAIQQAQASGNAALASALYEELLRQDTQKRADAASELERDYKERALLYEAEKDAYTMQQNAQEAARARVENWIASGGKVSAVSPDLLAASGYSNAELYLMEQNEADKRAQQAQIEARTRVENWISKGGSAAELPAELLNAAGYTAPELSLMEQYFANLRAGDDTYQLTWPQVDAQIKAGNLTPGVLAAYEKIMGAPYVATPAPEPSGDREPSGGGAADVSGYAPVADLNRPAPEYGTSYNIAANKVATMLRDGSSVAEVYSYLDSFSAAGLTDAGIAKILVDYGLTGG